LVSKWAVVAENITAEETFRQVSTSLTMSSNRWYDNVRVQTPVGHARLRVVRRPPTREEPILYVVTVKSKDYRRNRRNLLKVNEPELQMRSRRTDRKPLHPCKRARSANNHVGSTTPYQCCNMEWACVEASAKI
jgi:hypothetical protein